MAAGSILWRPAAVSVGVLSAGLALVPRTAIHAEAPADPVENARRKPIYDDLSAFPPRTPVRSNQSDKSTRPSKSTQPSPTDRLTAHIAHGRIFLHKYVADFEDRTNQLLFRAFNLEQSFTSTIASLAPGRDTNEKLVPGSIYVLIAAMGSSILVRNRNLLLRWTVPAAVGIGAGWAIIPITMRNVSDLAWTYEQRFPAVADTHIRARDSITHFAETGMAHSKMGAALLEEKIREARERVEGWVSKGR